MVDIDGNVYPSVIIGQQEWMAQNLRVSRFANGDTILVSMDMGSQSNLDTAATCSLFNFGHDEEYDIPYGQYYNWYAVTDPRNVCPAGWHVPSAPEWQALTLTLHPTAGLLMGELYSSQAGGLMKQTGLAHWIAPNVATSDAYGFNAVPSDYFFGYLNEKSTFWSTTPYDSYHGYCFQLDTHTEYLGKQAYIYELGVSVRCIKD